MKPKVYWLKRSEEVNTVTDFNNYQMETSQMSRIRKIFNKFSNNSVMKYCKTIKFRVVF